MPDAGKLQKFWIQIDYNVETEKYSINLKPAYYQDEPAKIEPQLFLGQRSFNTSSEAELEAEKLYICISLCPDQVHKVGLEPLTFDLSG